MAPRKRGGEKKRSSNAKQLDRTEDDLLLETYSSSNPPASLNTSRVGLICAAAATVLYFNSVATGGFALDDNVAVGKNPDVLNNDGDGTMSPFADVWHHDFWGTPVHSMYTHKSYRPLVILSYRFDAIISRDAWIFHLTNTLLYALTAWLVVDVALSKALSNVQGSVKNKEVLLLLSGLWFTSHPIHTEAVAGIVGRAEILAAIFCLLGVKLYKKTSVAAALCFGAACLCKETAVVMPIAVLAGEIAPLIVAKKNAKSSSKNGAVGLMVRSVCMICVAVGYLFFRSVLFAGKGGSVKGRPEDNYIPFLPRINRLRTAMFIMAKYFQLLVWPDRICCDYGLGVIDPVTSWLSGEIAFVAVVALIVTALAYKALMTTNQTGDVTLLLALGWVFGPLIPASHILDIGTVLAERLLFLPSIGMAMLICNLLGQQTGSNRKYSIVALSATIFIFSRKTMIRVPEWASTASLTSADVKTYPEGLKINTMVANILLNSTAEDALPHVEQALETASRYEKTNAFVDSREMDNTLKANIYGDKGSVLLRIAQRARNNQTILLEAERDFGEMQRRDIGKAVPYYAYCDFGLVLVFLGKEHDAYNAFQTCFKRTALTGSSVGYTHLRNYATLMRVLSGVANDDPNLAKAKGREALEAFRSVVDHQDATAEDAGKWERQIDQLKKLMAKSLKVE